MGRRLILDTNTLIGFERGRFGLAQFDEDDIAVAAVTVAEFHTGVELARTTTQRTHRRRVLDAILGAITVLDYTVDTAREHARLLAHTRRVGTPRGAHDLIIAAHAVHDDRILISLDAAAKFAHLPGVSAHTPDGAVG